MEKINYEWNLDREPVYPTYEEALERVKDLHQKKFGYRQLTPGEFFGFRRTYTALTGKECPPYTSIG